MKKFFGLFTAAMVTFGFSISPISAQERAPVAQKNVVQFSATNISTNRFAMRKDTIGTLEKSNKWENAGTNFSAYNYNKTKLKCVQGKKLFEFRSKINGSFYYVADPIVAKIMKKHADFSYTGIPFCVDTVGSEGSVGMYELVRFDSPVWYFTTSEEDVNTKVASGEWHSSGVVFYVRAAI